MKNLTNKQLSELSDILGRLKEAERFIERDDIKIVNTRYGEITKFVGSELNQIKNAISQLDSFIGRECK